MSTMPDKPQEPDIELFAQLVGQEIVDFIFETAPRQVGTRVGKALDHYTKALRLNGIDDEMGAVRMIAAEEELVVAIFEWLKLNTDQMPKHDDFIRHYKSHPVKLSFHPVLSQFQLILGDAIVKGVTLENLEDKIRWNVKAVRSDTQIVLRFSDQNGQEIFTHNPLAIALSWEEKSDTAVVDKLFKDFSRRVSEKTKMTVKNFVTTRADYRNKLLYANDEGFLSMGDNLETLIHNAFAPALRDLLWCLAILLGNAPATKDWGIVSQFISLYRRVLNENNLLHRSPQNNNKHRRKRKHD